MAQRLEDGLRPWGLAVLGGVSFGVGPATAQNPLDLERIAGGQIGAPLVFEVGGQDPLVPLPKLLVCDVSQLGQGLPVPPFGTLLLPLSPASLAFAGGASNAYSLPVNNAPGLVGLTVFAQALGPVAGQPFGTLGFSDLESVTLADPDPRLRLIYAAAALDGGFGGFAYDSASRRLHPCGFAALSENPAALCTSPDGRFVFSVEPLSGLVNSFRITSTCGSLLPTGSSVTDPGTQLLAADPLGRFLFAASPQTDRILTLAVDLASGAPSPSGLGSAPLIADPIALWVSAQGNHLYALSASAASLRRYAIDPGSGALTLQQSVTVPSGAGQLAVSPIGSLLVVLAPQAGLAQIFQRQVSNGALTALPAGVQALGFAPAAMALDDDALGALLHLSDPLGARVQSFQVLASSGALQPASPASLSLPSAPGELLLDPALDVLIASLPAESELIVLPLSAAGLPSLGARLRGRGALQDLAAARGLTALVPRTRSALLASEGTNELRSFLFSPSDGKLISTGGGSNPTGPGPVGVSLAPDNSLALSADFSGGSATWFPFDSITAQLGNGQAQSAVSPFDTAFEPGGRFAYVSNSGDSTLRIFASQGSQLIAAGSVPLLAGSVPRGLAIDPSGRFLYVALSLTNRIAAFRIDPGSGQLTAIASTLQSGGPFDVLVHPSGRFLYATLSTSDRVKAFAIDPFDGTLSQLSSTSSPTGALPTVLASDPAGRFLFCANSNGDSLSIFNIHAATGALTSATGSPLALLDDPRGLAVDASGSVLLVVNRGVDLVQAFRIPAGSGGLTGLSLSATGGDAPRGIALDLLWE
jgi:6-phosphogluconolactonase (cycloisomerase 2 family)